MSPSANTNSHSEPAAPIRVVIGEDAYLVREALGQILSRTDTIEVVRTCEDRDSLLAAIDEERPDAVLTDIRMPPGGSDEGIQVARALRGSHPEIGVVVLSQFAEPTYVLSLLESGSERRAYLLKERLSNPAQLVSAITTVAAGGSVIDPKVVDLLVHAQTHSTETPISALTPREYEVLAEVAQGKSNAAIAESLVLTKRAVEKHINAIFMKLNLASETDVSRRVKAALLFLAGDGAR